MAVLKDPQKYERAQKALFDHDPATAAQLLRELVATEPLQPVLHWSLGYALSEMHDHEHAISELQQAVKLDPRNVAALGCLGRAYMEVGEWTSAEKAFRERLNLEKSPQHYVFLAYVMMETNRLDAAVENCRKAIDLDPSFVEAYLNLALACRRKRDPDEAIDVLKEAIAHDPKYAAAYRELGLTYYWKGRFDLANQALRACIALSPGEAWAHLYFALSLQETGQFNDAAAQFAAALQISPNDPFITKKHEEFIERRAEAEARHVSKERTVEVKRDNDLEARDAILERRTKAKAHRVSKEQTVAVKGDKDFEALDAFLDELLEKKHYKRVRRKGSTSWVGPRVRWVGPRARSSDAAVRFKLCYFGPDRIEFGVRRDFVLQSGLTQDQIDCPDEFVVLPSEVKFVGFAVRNNNQSRLRIAKVIESFP